MTGGIARNEHGQPFMRCPACGYTRAGWNQAERPCPDCLIEWFRGQGVPILYYVKKEREASE